MLSSNNYKMLFNPIDQARLLTTTKLMQGATLPDFPNATRYQRIAYYRDKPLAWMATYLPDDFSSPFAAHHATMIEVLQIRGRITLVIISRNFGKGTILKGYTAHAICYGLEPYLTRMEHDSQTAQNELLDLIREFQTNPRILADYGNLCGDAHGLPWQAAKGTVFFVPPHAAAPIFPTVYVRYVGLDGMVRGTVTLHRKRVGRVIVNDPVKGYTEAHSYAHTQKVLNVLKADVGFAGGASGEHPISVTVIGTCQAKGDVIDCLQRDPAIKTLFLRGIEGDAQTVLAFTEAITQDMPNLMAYQDEITDTGRVVTLADQEAYWRAHPEIYAPFETRLRSNWEARFPLWASVFSAANFGVDTFLQEVQHISLDVKQQRFQGVWFPRYRLNETALTTTPYTPDTTDKWIMAIDTSGEPKAGTDPMAVICTQWSQTEHRLAVLEYWCAQSTAKELVPIVYQLFWRCYPWYKGQGVLIHLEDTVAWNNIGTAFFESERQRILQQARIDVLEGRLDAAAEAVLQRYWIALPFQVVPPVSVGNKLEGIGALRVPAQQGRIWLDPSQPGQALLLQQIEAHQGEHTHKPMPIERKNEGLDVLRMVWWHLTQGVAINHYREMTQPPALKISPAQDRAARRAAQW